MLLEITLSLVVIYLVQRLLKSRRDNSDLKRVHGEDVKPFSAIPCPNSTPFIGAGIELYRKGMIGSMFKWQTDRKERFGPIVREHIFGADILMIFGVDLIEELAKKDGKYPDNFDIAPWKEFRVKHNINFGLLTSTGPEWKKLRSPWNQAMLKTSKVYSGIEELNNITTDLMERIHDRRSEIGLVADLDQELFRWSLESAIYYLFEKRLGGFSVDNAKAERFITAVREMTEASEELFTTPVWLAKLFMPSIYKKHEKGWIIIVEEAKEMIDAKIAEVAKDLDEGVEPTGFLSYIISTNQLTSGEIVGSASEIMAAAVETTSNTVQFILYELSRNPEVQQKLYEEISEVTGGAQPTADHLRQMDYLKATVREVQRLYPVVLMSTRTLKEDTVVGGYLIPAKTGVFCDSFANGRSSKIFEDPLKLKPERWLKGEGSGGINPFSNAAFGFGARGCIGRKTAETEMHVFIIRLLQKFELKWAGKSPVQMVTRSFLVPKEPVKVSFVYRD